MNILELDDKKLNKLIDNRWNSSQTVWEVIEKTYKANLAVVKNEPEWMKNIPKKKSKVRANRVFVNMESVINTVIANPPKPTLLPQRNTPESMTLAQGQEKYFVQKYDELDIKEEIRKGLRNLYYSRLIVIKPFWNNKINDFDARAVDPRKVRIAKNATKTDDSEFAIEEVTDLALALIKRFPEKKDDILRKIGKKEEDLLIENPELKYKEAWIRDALVFKYEDIILGKTRNPYWDWDGLLLTPQEEEEIAELQGDARSNILNNARQEDTERREQVKQNALLEATETELNAYYFNHFDTPRKPYIIATLFNNEDSPIGQTDMITQAIPLQESVDKRKRQIDENADLVNGQIKVDESVMSKARAQALRFETGGVIWGKGVNTGVTRETGDALPVFVLEDMKDSRNEIDNIMAASSAFRGQREGQETKAGRLALIEQSFLRLNELVQVTDYVTYELFNWFYQLAKVRYTEHHYAKTLGADNAVEIMTLIQDDFENGTEVRVISGKMLPEDKEFKFEQAQADFDKGVMSPIDYMETTGYDNPREKAKNKVLYDMNPIKATGITEEEVVEFAPPLPPEEETTQ